MVLKSKYGNPARISPNMNNVRLLRTNLKNTDLELSFDFLYLPSENTVVTPTIKRKNGKIKSVGVHPNHSA